MIADIEILNNNIQKSYEAISSGYFKANLLNIRDYALHIARIAEKEIGYSVKGELPILPTPPNPELSVINCKYCNYQTTNGVTGIKSHHGIKHKKQPKQWT